ncbi:MAG: patatin-like phospholipase family protein [Proteobacteria bacterium]|nr:patatin-like phospholipase family protein [Pseudomonadota bacterium]
MTSRRQFLRFGGSATLAIAGSTLLAGCDGLGRGQPVPNGQIRQATILGVPNERFFPLLGADGLDKEFADASVRQARRRGVASPGDLDFQLLAVSGGGEDGAFGAGLLCGWTEHGDRPTFDLVTGVSTGALTAPLAFLGSAYDPQLRYVYTDITAASVLRKRYITAALFDDAMADNAPLYRTIASILDERMLAAIARGYDDGRLLLIGTTDLDAQQPVIWNIGAIAKSGHPRALDTVRRILLASAAIPGAFPPTMFDATLDGKHYQEMHVDGGAFVQSFLYPARISIERRRRLSAGQPVPRATAYLIRNGRLDANWSEVRRQTLGIAGRAISTMIFANGYNDTLRIYTTALRDGIDYNLAFIGPDFTMTLPKPFDRAYMRALFDYGFDRAKAGYRWDKQPALAG